jgi:putative ABC transport system permease protein
MGIVGEVRYALRALGKSPVFTMVAVLSLALGIGANTAVYGLVDSVLLNLLPVKSPRELVQLKEVGHHYGSNTGMNALSYPIYEDFRDQNQVFSGMLCRFQLPISVSDAGRNERTQGELVSGTYFQVLGVRAARGRVFTSEDDRTRSGAPYAVLAYDYWQTRYGGDTGVVGREILVNDHKLTVIGVSERGFEGVGRLFETQIYIPVMMAPQLIDRDHTLEDRRWRWVQVFARLKRGVATRQAKASLAPIFHHVLEFEAGQKEFAHASAYAREQFLKQTLDVMPGGTGQNEGREFLAPALVAMMALVGLVLLIACANVANLMIARSTARQKEIALRLSLGASRGRLVRQLLVESVLLSLAGGVAGLALLPATMRLLMSTLPQMDPPVRFLTSPDLSVLGFSLAVSLGTALLFGLAPALQTTRPDLAATLKDQAAAVAGGAHARWRKMLAAAQVSLSLMLLIAAGLFVRSLANLKDLNPGFQVRQLLTFSVDPTLNGYKVPQAKAFYKQLTRELGAVPSVHSVALCVVPPLSFDEWDSSVTVEGYAAKPGEDMNPWVNHVSPGFFATLKIPMIAGRDFTERDAGTPKVAIVNQKFARHYFGDRPAVGRHIGMGNDPGTKTDIEIIGVVGDTRYQTMKQEPPRQVFFPYLQNDWANQMTAYVRTDVSPPQMFPTLRAVVRRLDSNLPVYLMKTEERQRDDSLAVELLAASLSGAFGVLATVLAGIGLYGVMAFVVSRRTREIGIRMALGALTTDVVWLVMREVALLAGAGLVAGMAAALAVTRLLNSQLFGIQPNDPATIAIATAGIAAIAAVSGYIPARRATRVDPVTAIRWE